MTRRKRRQSEHRRRTEIDQALTKFSEEYRREVGDLPETAPALSNPSPGKTLYFMYDENGVTAMEALYFQGRLELEDLTVDWRPKLERTPEDVRFNDEYEQVMHAYFDQLREEKRIMQGN